MCSLAIFIILFNIFLIVLPVSVVYGAWWSNDWSYRKKLTIDHTKVAGSLSNFPVLIDLSDSDLASKAQGNGYDIVFIDNASGVKLNHEIEFFNNGTGRLIAWVNVPSLSSVSDTVLYMYYGNPSAVNQQNVAGTWDSNYVMVQHLNQAVGSMFDSTSNHNDGTVYGTTARNITGKVDGAVSFSGSTYNSYMDCGGSNTLNFGTGSFTVSLWVSAAAQAADYYALLKKNRVSDGEWGFGIRSGPLSGSGRDSLQFGVYNGSSGTPGSKIISTAAGVLNNAWRYVVAERETMTPSDCS